MNETFREKIFGEVLPLVEKPARYIGGELNIVRKTGEGLVRMALCFPDAYELGMSHTGMAILYHVINQHQDFAAERAYAPFPDMEERLRRQGLPLYTLETFTPLRELDVVGFSLQYELQFSNVLNMIDLGGIPLASAERGDSDPLIIAGGPCASNPEPMADFVDAVVLGDGEETIIDILSAVKRLRGAPRKERLLALAKIPGVYVPSFYKPVYSSDGRFERIEKLEPIAPDIIKSRKLIALAKENYPEKPLIPLIEITHDRLGVEIMRGCSRGCRFCAAGFFYRPVRERRIEDAMAQVQSGIKNSGWPEVSFLSLSATDYSGILPLLEKANAIATPQKVNLSLPSLRSDAVSFELLDGISAVRKSNLTIAPEAGSERMRKVINKNLNEDEILRSVDRFFSKENHLLKLYFMLGLPTETDADVDATADLIRKIHQTARRKIAHPNFNISVSFFSPKAHTPFQWVACETEERLLERARHLKAAVRLSGVNMNYSDGKVSFLESLFSRGDRRLGGVLLEAWKRGARFDAWTEHLRYEHWQAAFEVTGFDPQGIRGGFSTGAPLPWGHLRFVSQTYLRKEYEKALQNQSSADCRRGPPDACCGVCGHGLVQSPAGLAAFAAASSKDEPAAAQFGRRARVMPPAAASNPLALGMHFRLQYEKGEELRFLSHLDLLRIIERGLRRSGLPVAYSLGFNPHPKISLGPPASVGLQSRAEFFDVQMQTPVSGNPGDRLAAFMPGGIRVVNTKAILGKARALAADICAADYEAFIPGISKPDIGAAIERLLGQESLPMVRKNNAGEKTVNLRPLILALEVREKSFDAAFAGLAPILYMRLRMGSEGQGRPIEILRSLLAGWPQDEVLRIRLVRTAQWILRGDELISPMQG